MDKNNGAATTLTTQAIGRLLIEGELITHQDLEFAIEHQKYTNERIETILVRMGALDAQDLDALLKLHGKKNC